MYNGRKTSAARQQQWQLFRVLGADGVVIPTEVEGSTDVDVQLGGDAAPTPGPLPGPAGD
jgi:hypothetical protein